MSRGSAGITRNTLVTSDSSSSQKPPRKAAVTPTITASAVATRPTMIPSSRVRRIPTRSWDSTSCPLCVVPSRCAALGAFIDAPGEGFWYEGSYGVTSGPMMAVSTKRPNRTTPALALAGNRRHQPGWAASWVTAVVGADGRCDSHRVASRTRVRGSTNTMTRSTIRLASRTAKVITRKIACVSA